MGLSFPLQQHCTTIGCSKHQQLTHMLCALQAFIHWPLSPLLGCFLFLFFKPSNLLAVVVQLQPTHCPSPRVSHFQNWSSQLNFMGQSCIQHQAATVCQLICFYKDFPVFAPLAWKIA
jgi:hypothetical protein